ncbi:N-acetylneuraminate lyase [Companilactobacillus nodensis DSM 19682 = JCM 14932 = NBRC 107160]|uniref:N-acetylneuraminate lyase n=2 Tax=Companilactobacillus nodensis TaxID=460870 RepID=A0A0R1KCB6_9LACO|nr:N-acetylneuraminate lyase [Companilactobacillus nodensis]KRK81120.1 N-acetylneuraminate lyase [Companilactobacillus nodensis DSM 19682 = JCM 14932 = NBRC 107160]
MMKKLYSALMTAFNDDGSINEAGIREMIRYNIDVNKIDGLYVGGSTGENFNMSHDQKEQVFKIAIDEANGAIDLIAQVGSLDLNESKYLAKFVTDLGYPKISAVTPFYYNYTFEQIKNYYNEIVKDVDNKLLIYSIPALTGVSLSMEQFGELFENPKIIGIKYTNADFYLLERVRNAFPDKLILSGFDEMLLPALALGVDGAIGSTYNLNAKRAKAEMIAFDDGDIDKARQLQHDSNDLITALIKNDIYPSLKLVFEEMGVHAGVTKAPMSKPTPEMRAGAKAIYENYLKEN